MIPVDYLQILQANFTKYKNDNERRFQAVERLRKEFTQIFDRERIQRMGMDEFVVGEVGGKESFCYWLENKLVDTGNIKGGSTADKKFGLYYGKTKSDPTKTYRFINKYGSTPQEAFETIRSEILTLIDAGNRYDLAEIRGSIIPPMFKGKILSTYYPDKYLNVFSKEHLQYFCDYLGIPYLLGDDEVLLRDKLAAWKNSDSQILNWSLTDLGRFLYEEIKRPLKQEEITPELAKATVKLLPNITKLRPTRISNKTQRVTASSMLIHNDDNPLEHRSVSKRNYIIDHINAMNLGKRGEEAVIILERGRLEALRRADLAEKIKHISLTDDSVGYDILTYSDTGDEIFIEVKSTSTKIGDPTIGLSINELNFAKSHENYVLAIVFEADTEEPKVLYLYNPFGLPSDHYQLTPCRYTLQLAISDMAKQKRPI